MECWYDTLHENYLIHKRGRMIQGFTTQIFYSIPKRERANMFEPLMKIGLSTNLGNEDNANLYMEKRVGKTIV